MLVQSKPNQGSFVERQGRAIEGRFSLEGRDGIGQFDVGLPLFRMESAGDAATFPRARTTVWLASYP